MTVTKRNQSYNNKMQVNNNYYCITNNNSKQIKKAAL